MSGDDPMRHRSADLEAGLDSLAGLVADSLDLRQVLTEVATSAVRAIPGAEGAGVAVLKVERGEDPLVETAASAPFIVEIDDIQYALLREGPSITAASSRRPVRSGSLGGDKAWPRFGPRVGRLGVHSVLAVPLLLPDHVVGALSVYSFGKDVFDDDAARLAELFAKPAAVAVHNARTLAEALAVADQLRAALLTRPVIDQAIGIIRARTGCGCDEAFTKLRVLSQTEQRKLVDVAGQIVDEAVRRVLAARAQQAGVGPGV
ncbi:GAF and ANTAR domain-containing protein [Mycolicibacterium canariasense]|nr:GAF and ANTAR domain-containing protein [Mycolicibacterium canariasense]